MIRNGFFIKSIEIINFRGYQEQQFTFFKDDSTITEFIILGGPNGYGKSSLIDAIEWCLTGNIRRLEDDYRLRKETAKNMQDCLIRHNGDAKEVRVKIEAMYLERMFKIERVFSNILNEEECFDPLKSSFKVEGYDNVEGVEIEKASTLDGIINHPISSYFYERYTCSYEKNIRVYEKSRDDIYEMFSSFFGGTKEIETIINNLDGFVEGSGKKAKKVKGIIEEIEDDIEKNDKVILKTSLEKKEEAEAKLQLLLETKQEKGNISLEISEYPIKKEYQEELTPIEILNSEHDFQAKIDTINKQEKILEDIKFLKEQHATFNDTVIYIQHLKNSEKLFEFNNKVIAPYALLKEKVKNIQGKQITNIKFEINEYEQLIRDIKVNYTPLKVDAERLLSLSKKILARDDKHFRNFSGIINKIPDLEKANTQLETYTSTDPALTALRILIDNAEGFKKIREDGQQECPLCGSESLFPDKESLLTQTARNILGEIDHKREEIQKISSSLTSEIEGAFKNFREHVSDSVAEKIRKLNKVVNDFDDTNEFRQSCRSFDIDVDHISDEFLKKMKAQLEEKLPEDLVLSILESGVLNGLCNEKGEMYFITSLISTNDPMNRDEFIKLDLKGKINKVSEFIKLYEMKQNNLSITVNFSIMNIDELQQKTTILKEIQNDLLNDKLLEELRGNATLQQKLYAEKNEIYLRKTKELSDLKNISNEIKRKRNEWDRHMVDKIRQPLQRIYRRINRHTNINSIDLLIKGQISSKAKLVANIGDKEVSATNILSAGQLSVVALAIFLTVAMGQRDQPFKCYFMDDPIQTMDDLNVLSFIDLLRTELLQSQEHRFIDQLFFTTCNESLEKLITHKMRSFGVKFIHFHFEGYGKYEIKG